MSSNNTLPEEVADAIYQMRIEGFPLDADNIMAHITDLTRRLAEVEAESMSFRTECINLETQRAELEAFKARIMEWASGRCICGLVGKDCPRGRFDGVPKWATYGPCPDWTPPQAWEE